MNASHDLPHSAAVPAITSRLPNVGTTIFTVMSALAAQKGAVNLGQGFPDFACDPRIVDAVANAMRDGHNQYPPMAGAAPLRHAISEKIERLYGRKYDIEREITVTAGATQAILTAILCCVHPGDEVVVIAGGQVVAAGALADIRARAGNSQLEDAFVHLMGTGDEVPK